MILQITVIVLLMFSAGATIPVTLTEVTSPTDRFNQYVESITLHPDNPQLLIVTDFNAVHTFNPETKTKKLIAGSTSRGYVEGRGADARFDDIFGVSHFNETTIIVADHNNYCVRLVSLVSQLTERYAGVCQSRGYSDGERLSAKFNYLHGMTRVGTSYYICDDWNNKIRQLRGNSVSTVVSGINYPLAITSTQNKLFYSFYYGIGEFDLNSQTNKILTGGASSGSSDGSLSSARFGWLLGITSLTEKILLAADSYHNANNAVRLVDLNKRTVSSITMPTSPYSLLPYNGNILVGLEDGRIVKFSLTQLPADVLMLNCPDNMKLVLPDDSLTLNTALPRPDITGTRLQCLNCPPHTQLLSEGAHEVNFIFQDKLTKQNVNCSYQVDVIKPARICDIGVAEVHCPTDLKLILPHNVNQLNISLSQPQIDDTRLSCVECPDSVQLDTGDYNVTFSYMDKLYNVTIGCSYLITVIEQPAPTCHNETKRLFLQPNQSRTDKIEIGDTGVVIRFDEGEYEVQIRDGCYITYVVNEISTMNRQVQLKAEYPIKCQSLSKISLSILESNLKQHTKYLRKLCPVCQIDGSPSPLIECTNDTLITSWNTAITGDHQVMSDDTRNKLHSALVEFQSKYSFMDIIIFTTAPRTVSPIKDSDGLNLRVVIKTTCADKEFQYNKQYDVCERARQ